MVASGSYFSLCVGCWYVLDISRLVAKANSIYVSSVDNILRPLHQCNADNYAISRGTDNHSFCGSVQPWIQLNHNVLNCLPGLVRPFLRPSQLETYA